MLPHEHVRSWPEATEWQLAAASPVSPRSILLYHTGYFSESALLILKCALHTLFGQTLHSCMSHCNELDSVSAGKRHLWWHVNLRIFAKHGWFELLPAWLETCSWCSLFWSKPPWLRGLLFFPRATAKGFRKKAAVLIHQHCNITSAYLQIYIIYKSTSSTSHICRSTSWHICRSTSSRICRSDLHHLPSADLHHHTSADLHHLTSAGLHHFTSADLHHLTSADLHLYMWADLFPLSLYVSLSLFPFSFFLSFFLSFLRRGRRRRTATKRNTFARNGRRASKTKKNCDFEVSTSTLSHEMVVERQKLR